MGLTAHSLLDDPLKFVFAVEAPHKRKPHRHCVGGESRKEEV